MFKRTLIAGALLLACVGSAWAHAPLGAGLRPSYLVWDPPSGSAVEPITTNAHSIFTVSADGVPRFLTDLKYVKPDGSGTVDGDISNLGSYSAPGTVVSPLVYRPVALTDPGTATTFVSAGPVYDLVRPWIAAVFDGIFTALFGVVTTFLWAHYKIKLSDSDNARVQTAADNAAGRILGSLEPSMMNMKINIGASLIAAEIPVVIKAVGTQLGRLGITPELLEGRVAALIAGKIGQRQSQSSPAAVVVSPPLELHPVERTP